ncbi:MAG: threonine--tRNA ligase [Candidatus Pacearchaeota archaeon]|nr:threonine--tRNA ligase [Candidatus Pacearchaeota archaeon]
MKILTLHCDYIKFKPVKEAIKGAEKTEKKETIERECLVVLTTVEENDNEELVEKLVENIKEIASKVKCKKIVLYPYAHLSSRLARPEIASKILEKTEKALKKHFDVKKAPFGWYKEFELKCKGHPLAELSREITPEEKKEKLRKIILDKSKLSPQDHRILGSRLDLFSFNEVSPGCVFWHPKGVILRNLLINFWRKEHEKEGYKEISTPQLMSKKLWKISGHWDYYKENMFLTSAANEEFALKPMNCPGAILLFKLKPRSYKELPLRFAELGIVHRKELSGVLAGMFRVWQITQDDAHIFCTEEQLEEEIMNIIRLIQRIYCVFGFSYRIELSTMPKEHIGTKEKWTAAEKALQNALKKLKLEFKLNPGEGAFYGPKIDFHIKDSQGREWQCATIQVDFFMPEKFELKYTGKDNKQHTVKIIHRTIFGSIERFIGILTEHYNGAFPLWLSPVQIRVLSFTKRNVETAKKIAERLKQEGFRIETDFEDVTLDYKIREAELQKIPYIVVIGDKEEKTNTLAVRPRNKKPEFGIKLEDFIKKLKEQTEIKKLL